MEHQGQRVAWVRASGGVDSPVETLQKQRGGQSGEESLGEENGGNPSDEGQINGRRSAFRLFGGNRPEV